MNCTHCGDTCPDNSIKKGDAVFCCNGCKVVYEIVHSSGLESYYSLENNPGIKADQNYSETEFDFLELENVQDTFLLFKNDQFSTTSLNLPQIHCSACIWLLENLSRLHPGVISCNVNFHKKTATISFDHNQLSLKDLAELLSKIGYKPDFSVSNTSKAKNSDKSLIYKIGVAGFCFGNIMLFAFPEYLGLDESFSQFKQFFGGISLLCSLPVFFYAGWDYLKNGWKSLRQKHVNIDVPIALGMITLLIRSAYEIISQTGNGYLDSLSGLIFFLLIGRWFQKKSYDSLTFDRDYTSYFPIAASKYNSSSDEFETTEIKKLRPGDILEIRNGELIPADSIILDGEAQIDYSFVTGESDLSAVPLGENIFAGGRQSGAKIKIELTKKVNNSYLTELWNNEVFKAPKSQEVLDEISNRVSKYFTIIILIITFLTATYWYLTDIDQLWNSVTAVLIVACPCALALSVPFTLGSAMRVLGKNGLYLKSAGVIETMSKISSIIFDKTGTITHRNDFEVSYQGHPLSEQELKEVKTVTENSIHPLSLAINQTISHTPEYAIDHYREVSGAGIEAAVNNHTYKLGSASFTNQLLDNDDQKTVVSLTKDNQPLGTYTFEHTYREGLEDLLGTLNQEYEVDLLSGDNDREKERLKHWIPSERLRFNQSPEDKLNYIKELADDGQVVMMVGDGLNDAGALKQSHFGVAIADNLHQFSPASDAILKADRLVKLDQFLSFSKASIRIIILSFVISFLYNIVGLSFAITGNLSPIVAAILMPVSSVSVILFSTLAIRWTSKKIIR